MAAGDFSKPVVGDTYSNVLSEIRDLMHDLALLLDATSSTNVPTGAKRWNSTTKRFESYNGSSWVELIAKATDSYDISVTYLQNRAPGNSAQQIAVNNYVLCSGLNAEFLGGAPASYFAPVQWVNDVAAARAPLVNPSFSGDVLVPTAAFNDSTARAANTYFVQSLIAGVSVFPAGTRLLFHQNTAPAGWVKETNAYYNDKALRLVTGNRVDGGVYPFSTIFNYRTTVGHVLSVAELPPHNHPYTRGDAAGGVGGGIFTQYHGSSSTQATGDTGSGSPHTHDMELRVQFVDVIICQKA